MTGADNAAFFGNPDFLERLRERDHQAIEALVRAYTDQLYRTSLGLGFDDSAARELVQTTWATFVEAVGKFEGRSHIRTYLFGILYNKASEARRDHARFDVSDSVEELVEKRFNQKGMWLHRPIDPERFLLAAETREIIEECIADLPLKQRLAFVLKEIEENVTEEICNVLDVTVTHLGVLLFRARNRLRECIEVKAEKL